MRRIEKVETGLILCFFVISWMITPLLSTMYSLSDILFVCSGLLLAQSLVRDLSILGLSRNTQKAEVLKRQSCICLESTLGMAGVVIGAIVLFAASLNFYVAIASWFWPIVCTLVLIVGFLIKDLILTWNPLAIKREKDHLNIMVKWR